MIGVPAVLVRSAAAVVPVVVVVVVSAVDGVGYPRLDQRVVEVSIHSLHQLTC